VIGIYELHQLGAVVSAHKVDLLNRKRTSADTVFYMRSISVAPFFFVFPSRSVVISAYPAHLMLFG
jgi:hypothetical protein